MKRGRALGIDVGERGVGLGISGVTQTLASPFATLTVRGTDDAVRQVASKIDLLIGEDDELVTIIVGLPTKLDGSRTTQTARVEAFIETLAARPSLPSWRVDEPLASREAESRLAARERDWRRRKSKLDAAAAAIILQDYPDRQRAV